jgi:hypothetical protein
MGVADDTMKVGLLMEAAQAQQSLAATTLDKLREHTAGLDAIVREEIRATVLNELHALTEDSRHAAAALRRLQRVANLRLVAWSIGVLTLAAIAPLGIAWYLLPTPASVATLKATRDQLTSNIDRLSHQGARMELRRCGDAQTRWRAGKSENVVDLHWKIQGDRCAPSARAFEGASARNRFASRRSGR